MSLRPLNTLPPEEPYRIFRPRPQRSILETLAAAEEQQKKQSQMEAIYKDYLDLFKDRGIFNSEGDISENELNDWMARLYIHIYGG